VLFRQLRRADRQGPKKSAPARISEEPCSRKHARPQRKSANASKRSGGIFDVEGKRRRLSALDAQSAAPDFWNDAARAQEALKERARLSADVDLFARLRRESEDLVALVDLAEEAADAAAGREAEAGLSRLDRLVRAAELRRMLSGPQDAAPALLAINAGAGGTEAQDWVEMLLRMYLRWCARRGFSSEVLDQQPGDEAGFKSATVSVAGEYAYGYLRAEVGVHRLVRISPFDAAARRHTSFASVWVYPDIEDSIEVEVKEEDIEMEYFRSSGPGGQHVNKTESAVRIRHLPSGIVVQCQNERSQHKNKRQALRVLKARLFELELRRQEEKLAETRKQKRAIDFGSQIRSYVLAPYRLVTDHRTGLKIGAVDGVLDGEIDPFIDAFLLKSTSEAAG
jgi:peptide chain release factor 2